MVDFLVTIAWVILAGGIFLGVYCVAALGLLLYVNPKTGQSTGYVLDVVFAVTFPFVLAVVIVSILRR